VDRPIPSESVLVESNLIEQETFVPAVFRGESLT
jgi:hypothetical protein